MPFDHTQRGFLETVAQAWVLGAVIAIVLGGSQALSRSLFSRMIPAGREASFFGLYEISERGTSWIGPLVFGVVVGMTGSYRQAILSLIVLFVAILGRSGPALIASVLAMLCFNFFFLPPFHTFASRIL